MAPEPGYLALWACVSYLKPICPHSCGKQIFLRLVPTPRASPLPPAVGGGGTIFESKDGGATWQKDKSADDLPTNLYKIKFFGTTGYILGSNGVLLRLNDA